LASACLPNLDKAVEIDGEADRDGGGVGTPSLQPRVDESDCRDRAIVQMNPARRERLPTSAAEILEPDDRGRLQRQPGHGAARGPAAAAADRDRRVRG
jgi:predicted acylesterase/phospholipase RssA